MKPKLSSAQITSLDEFGNRVYLNPAEVQGPFRKYRTILQTILVVFFLGLPWTQMNGHQSLLFDIQQREFYIFGLYLRAHNAPMLLFLLLGGTLSLAFVTSVWGRVWCGWACPQTVFIDGFFRRIEYSVEGNYLKRRKMAVDPISSSFLIKKTIKWILFYFASVLISHSFLAYFVGSYQFFEIIEHGPSANWNLFVLAQVITLLLLFDFGWYREQFCTIMCPYGRIQGLLLDQSSLAVVYDQKRNDCVNCNRCVNACPIGIDIRNGLQMECIACTACIDACDEIMEKVNKPKGLVRYDTLNGEKINLLKPRSLIYLAAILICAIGLIYSITQLKHSEAFVLRSISTPYTQQTENGVETVTNQFRFHVNNQSNDLHKYKIEVIDRPEIQIISQMNEIELKPKETFDWHFFLTVPKADFFKNKKVKVRLIDKENPAEFSKESVLTLLGPSN